MILATCNKTKLWSQEIKNRSPHLLPGSFTFRRRRRRHGCFDSLGAVTLPKRDEMLLHHREGLLLSYPNPNDFFPSCPCTWPTRTESLLMEAEVVVHNMAAAAAVVLANVMRHGSELLQTERMW